MTGARLSAAEYADGVLAGDRAILARAITLAESDLPFDAALAQDVMELCIQKPRDAVRIGITGIPGVGKSTFIEALGKHLTSTLGETVAVLTVDPSSPISGGSILGDKTRMPVLSADPRAFIRPSPARGSLGGVTRKTREAILLCEAAGFDNILVETVGVGQSETAIASMVDFFLLLMLAGSGDELQGIKRGILEMTDLVAVNKCDGDNRTQCEFARQQMTSALQLFPPSASGWARRAVTCSAATGENVAAIWDLALDYIAATNKSGFMAQRRREQARAWMYQSIDVALRERFFADPAVRAQIADIERAVLDGRMSSSRAAARLLRCHESGLPGDAL